MNPDEQQLQCQSRIDEHRKISTKSAAFTASTNDREDLGQEILTQLWRSYPTFDGRCLFSTWMYRVALNTAISFMRSELTRKRHVESGGPLLMEYAQAPKTESAEVRTMYQLITSMDPLHRALILLYLDGNSYEEIGVILGISVTNVATKPNRVKNA